MVPRPASRRASAATKVLVMLATEKSVSAVTGAAVVMTPTPDWPVQVDPSGKTIAAWMPGRAAPALMESRASARAVSVVAPSCATRTGPARSRRGVGTGTIVGVGSTVAVAAGVAAGVAGTDGEAVGVGLG